MFSWMLKSYSNIGLDFAHKENSEYFRSDNIHRLQGSDCDLNIDHFNMRENDVSSLVQRSMSMFCFVWKRVIFYGMVWMQLSCLIEVFYNHSVKYEI